MFPVKSNKNVTKNNYDTVTSLKYSNCEDSLFCTGCTRSKFKYCSTNKNNKVQYIHNKDIFTVDN